MNELDKTPFLADSDETNEKTVEKCINKPAVIGLCVGLFVVSPVICEALQDDVKENTGSGDVHNSKTYSDYGSLNVILRQVSGRSIKEKLQNLFRANPGLEEFIKDGNIPSDYKVNIP